MESTILIFRIHSPMPTDSSPHSLSFPAQAHALVKKSRGVVAGGRGRSATTSTSTATDGTRNRSRSTATAPPSSTTPASTATCPNTKFTKYSVAALEAALGNDIERLHSFAANTELSGENILFLKSVEMWKTKWRACTLSSEDKVRRWEEAHKIWARLVDRDTAEFPLNIEDAVYRNLERVFGNPHTAPTPEDEEKSCIVPFADDVTASRHSRRRTTGNSDFSAATAELMLLKETLGITMVTPKSRSNSNPAEASRSPPPHEEVTLEVFDKAEASVRQMVLENTWIRYVDSMSESCSEALMSSSPTAGCHSWRWKSVFRKKSYQKFLGAGERD